MASTIAVVMICRHSRADSSRHSTTTSSCTVETMRAVTGSDPVGRGNNLHKTARRVRSGWADGGQSSRVCDLLAFWCTGSRLRSDSAVRQSHAGNQTHGLSGQPAGTTLPGISNYEFDPAEYLPLWLLYAVTTAYIRHRHLPENGFFGIGVKLRSYSMLNTDDRRINWEVGLFSVDFAVRLC